MSARVSNLRRGRWQSWVCGLAVTVIVASLQVTGHLDFAERWSFDKRVKYCQLFYKRTAPSPVVVMLVDDATLRSIGPWPWPRATVAEVIGEIDRCGARTIGLDVLLKEAKEGDDVLADMIARSGKVVVPIEIELATQKADGALVVAMRELLRDDPELEPAQIATQIAGALRSRSEASGLSGEALHELIDVGFADARDDVLLARINTQIDAGKSDDEIRRATLPKAASEGGSSPLTKLLDELLVRARTAAAARGRLPVTPNQPPLLAGDSTSNNSLQDMLAAARSIGFVDFKLAPGGKLYWVPLLADFGGRMMPQFALAVACAQLGVDVRDPNQFRLTEDWIELRPANGPPISIPIRTEQTAERNLLAGTLFEVPLRGRRSDPWTMFDSPHERGGAAPKHVFPATRVGDLLDRRASLRRNNEKLDRLIRFFLSKIDIEELDRFNSMGLPGEEFVERRAWLMKLVNHPQLNVLDADYRELKPDELDADANLFIGNYRSLTDKAAINDGLLAEIASMRNDLRSLLQDRAVILGFAASGRMDQVSTALHDTLPGAMVHAAIVNAILGGEMWRKAPLKQNVGITLLLGMIATWIVTSRGQYRSHLAALALLVTYTLINGFLVFDFGNYILTLGYPMIVIAGVWGIVTARRALVEALERAKVEGEFRTYVDPALVDYVLANKTGGRIRAQRREMSIVFLDLEGFTAGSEQLKSRAARVVNFYMDAMVKIIRANGGYVNKFLGDGIMFFFNAPNENNRHAQCAVRTVLEIQSALQRALSGRKRRRTAFKVRAGISTGVVTVGDAGSSDASDYTVLGDIANLGSRLESANKQFGTNCAVTQRTLELCNGEFLMRPLGRFRVVGRTEPVEVFEPLASIECAGEPERACAHATAEMVRLFKLGDFTACLAAIQQLEFVDRATKLTELYRRQCNRCLANPSSAHCESGVIDLTEK